MQSARRTGRAIKKLAPMLKARFAGKPQLFFWTSGLLSTGATSMGALSDITCPSFNSITLSPYFSADSLSWETTMTSVLLLIFFKRLKISSPVSLSSAPVGSSHNKISGFFTMARAIATRCFCPPERRLHFLSAKPSKSTDFKAATTKSPPSFTFINSRARETLRSTVYSSRRLFSWKTKPTFSLRCLSVSFAEKSFIDFPSIITSPPSKLSNPPKTFKRVDLPHPDLPRINTMPFSGKSKLTPFSAGTSAQPFALYVLFNSRIDTYFI